MADFDIGSILDGRYEILNVLGSGGMGRVYKARQLNLDRIVAIKVPSDAVLKNEEFLARFVREGSTCARVAHGHIVAIYDVHSGMRPYIVMEYVDGMPLNQFLQEEQTTLFVSDLLEIIGQVCQGLAAAHASGIVHRDIKPANIVITNDNHRVKVMDFGIARVSDNTSLTTAGSMMGTPFYMAPEQIRGEKVEAATDLYALACVVYLLLTGRLVFDGEVATLIYKHMSANPTPPSQLNPMLPKAVDAVLLRALHKNPGERYASTLEFHRELRKAMRPITQLPYSQIFTQPELTVVQKMPRKVTGPSLPSQRTLTSPPKTTPAPGAPAAVSTPLPTPAPESTPVPAPKSAPRISLREDTGAPGSKPAAPPLAPTLAPRPQPAAVSPPTPAPKSPATPLPVSSSPVSAPVAPVPTPPASPIPAERPRRRLRAGWVGLGIGIVLLAAVAGVLVSNRQTDVDPDIIWPPRSTPTPRKTVTPTPKVSPTPAPAAERKLQWLGEPPAKTYASGDYFRAWWIAASPDATSPPVACRVTLLQVGTGLSFSKRAVEKFAYPLDRPGRYRFTVEVLEGQEGAAGSLEAEFDVTEAPPEDSDANGTSAKPETEHTG